MVTRAQVGTVKPNPRFHGHTSHISPIPKYRIVALSDSNWRDAIYDEYNALIKNSTWILVLKPPNANVVRSMWLFRYKYHADGSLSSLALSRNWPIHQLDVKNAFLNGDLSETVYMHLVLDFNGLLDMHYELGFLRVDCIISSLYKEFDMTNLGALNYFLGISVTHDSTGMFLSQKKYAMELLDRAHMDSCNPTRTPVCLYMHDPREPHFLALKHILRYVRGTRSTLGYCVFFGDNLLLSVEAEYRGVANVVAEIAWIRNLLRELHMPLLSATLVYCDNVSAIYLTTNPVQHQQTKHIEIDIHFVRDMVAHGHVRVLHVPSRYQ
ncbi:ribonuclease H-like domain-containing protein [Tanacetum coccineum]